MLDSEKNESRHQYEEQFAKGFGIRFHTIWEKLELEACIRLFSWSLYFKTIAWNLIYLIYWNQDSGLRIRGCEIFEQSVQTDEDFCKNSV